MVPPSATDGVALRLTVVVSTVSVMVVVAAAGLTDSTSKLPPAADAIVVDTLPASTYTSSLGAATLTLPLVAPAATVVVAPLLGLTLAGVSAALLSVAV